MPLRHPAGIDRRSISWATARLRHLDAAIAPFASQALDVASLLPEARWPQQIEIHAGKYLVRPRYEVKPGGRHAHRPCQCRAHRSESRSAKSPSSAICSARAICCRRRCCRARAGARSRCRRRCRPRRATLPIALIVYDARGREAARHRFGNLARKQSVAVDVDALLNGAELAGGYGHMELVYDFSAGGDADGWLHALFRYEDRESAATPPRPASARMSSTPCSPTRASRNPMPAGRPACRPGSSCASGEAPTTRSAT